MRDLGAYLRRIGLDTTARPSWPAVHRAHAVTIPFENLDPHRGVPVSLEPDDLEDKLVRRRRGGYCFEHNLLLGAALQELGLTVEPMLARVRSGGAPPDRRAPTHLLLRVSEEGGRQWHADVGFGNGTLLDPIPFGPGAPHEQSGWEYRVVEEGEELVLQAVGPDGWSDVYGFVPTPARRVDIEMSNWWVCTHPGSPFVSGFIVCATGPHGRRRLISDWSGTLQRLDLAPGRTTRVEESWERVPALLAEDFGLPGFALGPGRRVVPAGEAGPR